MMVVPYYGIIFDPRVFFVCSFADPLIGQENLVTVRKLHVDILDFVQTIRVEPMVQGNLALSPSSIS